MKLWIIRNTIGDEFAYWSQATKSRWSAFIEQATVFNTSSKEKSPLPAGDEVEWVALPRL